MSTSDSVEEFLKHPPECPWHRDWHACSCGLFDTVIWEEPDESGAPVKKWCDGETAARAMFTVASSRGHRYATVREAIDDFVTVNWASYL